MKTEASKNYRQTRIALLERGTTLRRWALSEGLPVGTVYNSVRGLRNGVEAHRIRRKLESYLYE